MSKEAFYLAVTIVVVVAGLIVVSERVDKIADSIEALNHPDTVHVADSLCVYLEIIGLPNLDSILRAELREAFNQPLKIRVINEPTDKPDLLGRNHWIERE